MLHNNEDIAVANYRELYETMVSLDEDIFSSPISQAFTMHLQPNYLLGKKEAILSKKCV